MSRSPEEHLDAVRALLPGPRTERVNLDAALDRRLAEAVTARWDSPRFDNSQMDGYAVGPAHLGGGIFPVGPTLAAGTDPDQLYPLGLRSRVCPIMTGARLPRGTAAVVPVERTDEGVFTGEGRSVGLPPATAGDFLRARGSDIAAGTEIIPAGTVLGPVHLGLLASQSIAGVTVFRRPRIVIVTGGTEITSTPSAATIPDANGPLLRGLAARTGMEILEHLRTNDNPARLALDLEHCINRHQPDAIITSGGISLGRFEVVRQVLETTPGAWFGHVDQQPGGPQGLALLHGTPVICLPGNPVSTLVSFVLFLPAGFSHRPWNCVDAVIDREVTGLPGGREQFLRGTFVGVDTQLVATPLDGTGSHLLARAAGATCLIRVPAGTTVEAGSAVRIYPLP
ncbi:molybdopterin molybdotransferase MoeA [Corynebacterium pacaense]|uniref:molybdopterin molybdotransferase MoeA n=1 Tax=Corynebacterium pacaense TaxID=1816684 RepID=UPI0009B94AC1|nr:molybdopterin molybdotransferase MoeA [Corynebacterium pacaense]